MKSQVFIARLPNGPIFFGHSTNIDRRLKSLKKLIPSLEVIGSFPGTRKTVDRLKKEFKHLTANDPWFSPDDTLLQRIDELLGIHCAAGEVRVKVKYMPLSEARLEMGLKRGDEFPLQIVRSAGNRQYVLVDDVAEWLSAQQDEIRFT